MLCMKSFVGLDDFVQNVHGWVCIYYFVGVCELICFERGSVCMRVNVCVSERERQRERERERGVSVLSCKADVLSIAVTTWSV